MVEVVLDDREPQLSDVEAGAFGEPSAQQCVGVLVGGSLPRRARLAEEHFDAERGLDVGPAGHLAALVPGEAAHEPGGLAAQRRGDRGGDLGRAVAVGQRCGDRVAAGALGERDRGGEVRFADDEVAVPVAGLCTVLDVVGPIVTNGWYPDPDDSLGGLQLLARVFNEEADREDDGPVGAASDSGDVTRTADDLMSEKTRDKLEDIEADLCAAFPLRSPILREAFEAHRQARFNLSVPVLIAQADGIWHDRCKKSPFTSHRKSAVHEMLMRPDAHTAAPLARALLGGKWPLARSQGKRKPEFSQLNRHQVLHGEATDYGTEVNSLKAISFIRFCGFVLSDMTENTEISTSLRAA